MKKIVLEYNLTNNKMNKINIIIQQQQQRDNHLDKFFFHCLTIRSIICLYSLSLFVNKYEDRSILFFQSFFSFSNHLHYTSLTLLSLIIIIKKKRLTKWETKTKIHEFKIYWLSNIAQKDFKWENSTKFFTH